MQCVFFEEFCLQIKVVLFFNMVSLFVLYVKVLVVLMWECDVYRECFFYWSVVSCFMKCYM